MKTYTPADYLKIDIANHFGLDKLEFEDRIEWVNTNINDLESLADKGDAKTRPLFIKAVMVLRKAQKGIPTGHVVALDAVCSGMQIMSAISGCEAGAYATGLIDPNKRMDAYSVVTTTMNQQEGIAIGIPRGDAKDAVMKSLYGSRAEPKNIFGEGTSELNAFYKSMNIVCPGAWNLLQTLLDSWNPYALFHAWKLPDGYDARVKVMQKKEIRIEVDELDHATFTYEFFVNEGTERGLSNVANVVHSLDAYVLRCMERRCNYNVEDTILALTMLTTEQMERANGKAQKDLEEDTKLRYYVDQYNRSSLPDVVILAHLTTANVAMLSDLHIVQLLRIVNDMLKHNPFALLTVHDAFGSHANYSNWVRWHYKEILADLADSNVMNDLLSQVYGFQGTEQKLSNTLGDKIRKSNYGLS